MHQSKVKFTILANESSAEGKFPNNVKTFVEVAFLTIADVSKLPDDIVTISLLDQDEKPIASFDAREWQRRSGGTFMSSCVPINTDKQNLTVSATTKTAPVADVVMEMVLIHKAPETC